MTVTNLSPARSREPKPLIPDLAIFYPVAADLSWVLIRLLAGLLLLPHGWPKLMAGPAAVGANVAARRGFEPALFFGFLLIFLETVGGIMIALGLFTRFIAALLLFEFIVIWQVHAPRGWSGSVNGLEYVLLWGLLFFAILLRGGGPYSLDRKLGWEL